MDHDITQVFPQLLCERKTSRMLGVSIAALRRWRREGRGPQFTRLERCVRYDLRAIERFLKQNCSWDEPVVAVTTKQAEKSVGDSAPPSEPSLPQPKCR